MVNVFVTNTTGSEAVLSGWIDYNSDGVFDNATRARAIVVADGSLGESGPTNVSNRPRWILRHHICPLPLEHRFGAAENPTGFAADGEVEDHLAAITSLPGTGIASRTSKIAHETGGGPTLSDN